MKALSFALLAALALAVCLRAAHPVGNSDFGWQVALGRQILERGAVPDADGFTHTARGAPMVAHQWASQVLEALVVDRIGVGGLRVANGLLVTLASLVLFGWARRSGASAPVAVAVVAVWACLAVTRFQHRPHLWNVLLFALAYGALFAARPVLSRGQLVGFFALSAAWTNLHSGATLLPAVSGVLAAAATFERRVLGRPARSSEVGEGRLPRLWALAGLSLLGIVVSPNHVELFGYLLESGQVNARLSLEWASIASARGLSSHAPAWILAFYTVTLATVVAAVVRRRDVPLGELAVVLFVTFLPFVSQRFTWTCFVPVLFLAGSLPAVRWRDPAALAASALAIGWLAAGVDASSLGRDFRPGRFPVEAMTFLEETDLSGRLFAPNQWGGYVLYRTGERYPVFVDGRWVTLGERVVRDSHSIAVRGPGYEALLDAYEIEILLVPRGWMTSPVRERGGWITAFENWNSGVYLRPGPSFSVNLDRVADYYAPRGIPFSSAGGFDERAAAERAPAWARTMGVQRRHLDLFGAHGRQVGRGRWVDGW